MFVVVVVVVMMFVFGFLALCRLCFNLLAIPFFLIGIHSSMAIV